MERAQTDEDVLPRPPPSRLSRDSRWLFTRGTLLQDAVGVKGHKAFEPLCLADQ